MRKAGPYSAPSALARLDQRSREARIMAGVRADLTAHVGGKPSATQRMLIDRAARLSLQVAQLDAKMSAPGGLTEHDHRTYLAWSNTLTRTLRTLGLTAVSQRPMTAAEALSRPSPSTRGIAA